MTEDILNFDNLKDSLVIFSENSNKNCEIISQCNPPFRKVDLYFTKF